MTGTLINIATVLAGGTAGTLLGARLPERVRETVMHGIGLMTVFIGLSMALKTQHPIILLGSIVLGGIVGELLGVDHGLRVLGDRFEGRFGALFGGKSAQAGNFSKGFVTASLIFCVGPMTILGSIQDGLTGDYSLLAIKSVLDGFTALALSATFGVGVAFAAVTVLVYQGALTLGAAWARALLTEPMVTEMSAAGGLIILGIGLVILDLKPIRVANFLPALVFAPALVALFGRWV